MAINDSCPVCHEAIESTMHVLRDYKATKEFWMRLVNPKYWLRFFSVQDKEWLLENLTEDRSAFPNAKWELIFGIALYNLGGRRNSIFKEEPDKGDLAIRTLCQAKEVLKAKHSGLWNNRQKNKRELKYLVGWNPPPIGFFKFNIDGAVEQRSNTGSCGGVLRDIHGSLLGGFVLNLGRCSVLETELWAIFHVLSIAWDIELRSLIVESDSI